MLKIIGQQLWMIFSFLLNNLNTTDEHNKNGDTNLSKKGKKFQSLRHFLNQSHLNSLATSCKKLHFLRGAKRPYT